MFLYFYLCKQIEMGNKMAKWMVGAKEGQRPVELGEIAVIDGESVVVVSNDQLISELQSRGVVNLPEDRTKLTPFEELNYKDVLTLRGQFVKTSTFRFL